MLPEAPVSLITGAGSGIGRALAIGISGRGGPTVLAGRRRGALESTANAMAFPDRAICVAADITDAKGRRSVIDTVAEIGRLDVLFNNAGIISAGSFADTTDADMERMLATNVLAPFSLTRDLIPFLKQGVSPAVVNIGSMFGDIAFPYFTGYAASKFALRGVSDGLRRELAPLGIAVVYAAPRAASTEGSAAIAPLLKSLGTAFDDPVDVADHILKSVDAGKRFVYPGAKEKFFVLMARLFPHVVDGSITKQIANMEESIENRLSQ
jgi:short-subunit dehydrogenase